MKNRPSTEVTGEPRQRVFPSLTRGHYFNHAAVAPWPACTAEAVKRFAVENAHQGPVDYARWIATENRLREQLAQLLGADSTQDIALLKNTTECISTVAFGIDWKAGENVVLPLGEFPSNRLPWLAQAARGVEIREVDIRSAGHAESSLLAAMDSGTRLLAVSSVQWSDGFRLDLPTLGEACRERGILFFVDAIQQLGALRLDATACHASFIAADAHKWMLGPEGIAVFYSSPEARQQVQLQQLGWHMFDRPWDFGRKDWTPADSARRFEAGSPNSLGQAALHASLDLLLGTGMDEVERRVLDNTRTLVSGLEQISGVRLASRSEPERQSGIVSFIPPTQSARQVQLELERQNIVCAVRESAVRLSPHYYQGKEEIESVLSAIRQIVTSCAC